MQEKILHEELSYLKSLGRYRGICRTRQYMDCEVAADKQRGIRANSYMHNDSFLNCFYWKILFSVGFKALQVVSRLSSTFFIVICLKYRPSFIALLKSNAIEINEPNLGWNFMVGVLKVEPLELMDLTKLGLFQLMCSEQKLVELHFQLCSLILVDLHGVKFG